jgi:hypothetical protein
MQLQRIVIALQALNTEVGALKAEVHKGVQALKTK